MYEYRKLSQQAQADLVQERILKGLPPHSPPHPMQIQGIYLISAACYGHGRIMSVIERRFELLDAWIQAFQAENITLFAWVVLPNHYHFLVQLKNLGSCW